MRQFIFSAIILITALLSQQSFAASVVTPEQPSLAPMIEKVKPSIVNINATFSDAPTISHQAMPQKLSPEEARKLFGSQGSGVIIDSKNGLVITNHHVVTDASNIIITLYNGQKFKATLKGNDPATDLAVLQIQFEKNGNHSANLKAIEFSDSDKAKVGDFVVAIGSPFGLEQTVTSGIVSATSRSGIMGSQGYENFIQTDAPINPGNSGGALVDLNGKLLGINTAIITPGSNQGNIGIGFAVPANIARFVSQELIQYGKVSRGIMGVIVGSISSDIASALKRKTLEGAIITQVSPNTPAFGKLQVGDIITKINGREIESAQTVRSLSGLNHANSVITLEIERNGTTLSTQVSTVSQQELEKNLRTKQPFLYGLSLEKIDQQRIMQGHVKGVAITALQGNSPSAEANLLPGDVIVSVNNKPTTTVSELNKICNEYKGDTLLMNVLRGNMALLAAVKRS